MGSNHLEIDDWADLDRLDLRMDEVGAQVDATVRYAVAWMCRRDGFATSPACLLRPLAEVMDRVGEAFTVAGRRYADDWQRLRDGVVLAKRDLHGSDVRAADRTPSLETVAA